MDFQSGENWRFKNPWPSHQICRAGELITYKLNPGHWRYRICEQCYWNLFFVWQKIWWTVNFETHTKKKVLLKKYRIQAVVSAGLRASFSGIDDSTWHKTNLRNALGIMDTTVWRFKSTTQTLGMLFGTGQRFWLFHRGNTNTKILV